MNIFNLFKITSHSDRIKVILIAFNSCKMFGTLPMSIIKTNYQPIGSNIEIQFSLTGCIMFFCLMVSFGFSYSFVYDSFFLNGPVMFNIRLVFVVDLMCRTLEVFMIFTRAKRIRRCLNRSLQILFTLESFENTAIFPYLAIIGQGFHLLTIILVGMQKVLSGGKIDLIEIPWLYVIFSANSIKYIVITLCYISCIAFNDISKQMNTMNTGSSTIFQLKKLMSSHWLTGSYMIDISFCFGPYFLANQFTNILRTGVRVYSAYIFSKTGIMSVSLIFATANDILMTFFILYNLALINDNVIHQAKKVIHHLQVLVTNHNELLSRDDRDCIRAFVRRTFCRDLRLSACGYFTITRRLVSSIIYSTIAYIIVLIQLDISINNR